MAYSLLADVAPLEPSRSPSLIVKLDHVEKSYRLGKTTVNALRGVSLTLREREFVVVMGPSGSGKTTLLNIIGTLDRASSCQVLLPEYFWLTSRPGTWTRSQGMRLSS